MAVLEVEPDFAYLKLRCSPQTQDIITWRLIIDGAIGKSCGKLGLSIPIDILSIADANDNMGFTEAIIKCPWIDKNIVAAAVSGSSNTEYSVILIGISGFLNMLL